jgi:hypothetical protein
VPEDGQCLLDWLPAPAAVEGWRLPWRDAQLDGWGLAPGPERDFVEAAHCDFALRCWEEPVRLPVDRKASLPSRYLMSGARSFFEPFATKARENAWPVYEIRSGHHAHVERPAEVADALLAVH